MAEIIFDLLTYSLITSILTGLMILLYRICYINDRKHLNKIRIADFAAMALIIFITSIRYGVGSDYYKYLRMAKSYSHFFNDFSDLFKKEVLENYSYQVGYPAVSVLAFKLFNNEFAVFFVVACIIYIPYTLYFRKKSVNVFYSFLVYILFGFWGMSLNVLKQAIAMVCLLTAFEFLKEKKFVRFAILVLIGITFHSTALLAALGLVVARFIKPTIKNLYFCIAGGIALKLSAMMAIKFLTSFSIFNRYYSRYILGDSVVGVGRTLVPIGVVIETILIIFSVYLAIGKRDALCKMQHDIDSYISVVMISIPFGILGVSESLWLANRFAKYFSQFLVILIPAILMTKSKKIEKAPFKVRIDSKLSLILVLFIWHFLYSSLMLDNNFFVIDTLLFK